MRPALTAAALIALPFALLPLAACSKGPTVTATNATQAEVAQKVAAATGNGNVVTVNPGRWEGSVTISEMDIPGMPAAARELMKAQMGGAKSFVNCVTEDDVKRQKAFFTGDRSDRNCTYDHFTLADGKIDAAMHCNRASGAMAMTMTGSYSPDAYHLDMASRGDGKGPMGAMSMKMSIEAKRVGACRGSKDEL